MKKVLSALVLSAAVVASAGQAYAYGNFNQANSLHLGMYDYSGFGVGATRAWEIGVDLGTLNVDFSFNESNKYLGSTAVQNAFGGYEALFASKGATVADIRVGMFMRESPGYTYFATTSNIAPTIDPDKTNSGMASLNITYEMFDNAGVDGFASFQGKNANGYMPKLDGTQGGFSGMNRDSSHGSINVGNISGDYVDFYLWRIVEGVVVNGDYADYQAVLRFEKEGAVLLNPNGIPAPVPVPAAAWLLGSGLLGLIGLRRRNA
jgi:hypothetical protein